MATRPYECWSPREVALLTGHIEDAGHKRVPMGTWLQVAIDLGRPIGAVRAQAKKLRRRLRGFRRGEALKPWEEWRPEEDAAILDRLRRAGPKNVPNGTWREIACQIGRSVASVTQRASRLRGRKAPELDRRPIR